MVLKSFFGKNNAPKYDLSNELSNKLTKLFPDADENELSTIACISGLMARIAWCDLDIHKDEVEHMKKSLGHWMELSQKDIDTIVTITLEHTKELAGVESYKYTEFLVAHFTTGKRFGLLKALFALAASDGTVAEREAEEIRIVSKGLLLEPKHFAAAKATVLEFLGSLR